MRDRATIPACDSLIARYAGSDDSVTVGFVADALWIEGRALAGCGESERERAVLRRSSPGAQPRRTRDVQGRHGSAQLRARGGDHSDVGRAPLALWDAPPSTAPRRPARQKPTSGRDQPSQRGPGNLRGDAEASRTHRLSQQRRTDRRGATRETSRYRARGPSPPTRLPHPGIATSKLNQGTSALARRANAAPTCASLTRS